MKNTHMSSSPTEITSVRACASIKVKKVNSFQMMSQGCFYNLPDPFNSLPRQHIAWTHALLLLLSFIQFLFPPPPLPSCFLPFRLSKLNDTAESQGTGQ